MTFELRPKQIKDLAYYIKNDRWMNLSDPGVGKTPSVCVYFEYLWKHKNCKSYWSMPKSLLRKNKREIHNFTNLTDDEVIIVDGTPKQRDEQMRSPNAKVFLMGFTRFSDDWATMKKYHPELNCHVVDEFHMGFKSPDSKRSKNLFYAMRRIKYFGVMSGTIIDGRLDSCYPAIHIIEPRYYANHYSFLMQHAVLDENGKVMTWDNHDKLGRIFLRHGIRRTFEQEYGKEEPVIQMEWCDMHPKQQKAFDQFERDAILELDEYLKHLENDILDGTEPGVKTMRCRQIMAHPETFKILKDKEMTGKDEALLIHAEDHINKKERLLVYSVHKGEQVRIAKLFKDLGLRVGLINGSVSAKKRGEIDEAFQAHEIDVVVASPETTAVGYNWGFLNHIIYASIDYKDSNFSQGYKRGIRGKRKQALRVTVLGYDNDVERKTFWIVNGKSRHMNKVDKTYKILRLGVD